MGILDGYVFNTQPDDNTASPGWPGARLPSFAAIGLPQPAFALPGFDMLAGGFQDGPASAQSIPLSAYSPPQTGSVIPIAAPGAAAPSTGVSPVVGPSPDNTPADGPPVDRRYPPPDAGGSPSPTNGYPLGRPAQPAAASPQPAPPLALGKSMAMPPAPSRPPSAPFVPPPMGPASGNALTALMSGIGNGVAGLFAPGTPQSLMDRLMAGATNLTTGGNPIAGALNAVNGLATGQRTDRAGIALAQQQATMRALMNAGLDAVTARAAAIDPNYFKAVMMARAAASSAPQRVGPVQGQATDRTR